MHIDRLWPLWDAVPSGEELSEVGLAIIKEFMVALRDTDGEEKLKTFLRLARLGDRCGENVDRAIRGFGYDQNVTIKFTDVAEGPVCVITEDGDDILVSSVENDGIFAVLSTEERTVSLFLTRKYPHKEFIIKILEEWGIDGFVTRNPMFVRPAPIARFDTTEQQPGHETMWSSI